MRALKTILIILLSLAALVVVLGLVGPKHSRISRSTMIAAPPGLVWEHMSTLAKQNEWSPFLAMDPGAKVTYEGTDGEVGAKSAWQGEQTGTGEQVITRVEPGKQMDVDLHFIAPFEGQAKGSMVLDAASDSTRVTWSYDGENNFIARIMCVFKDMDAMMGPVFASGLDQLKKMCEADAAEQANAAKAKTFRGYTVETVDRPAVSYLGKRQKVKWEKLSEFFGSTFPMVAQAASKAGLTLSGAPTGLYFDWDTTAKQADVFAGIPVQAAPGTSVAGLQVQDVPAGKAVMVAYTGAYEKSGEANGACEDMMKANGLELNGAVIEEYITDPGQEPDTAKWLMNIYYPLK